MRTYHYAHCLDAQTNGAVQVQRLRRESRAARDTLTSSHSRNGGIRALCFVSTDANATVQEEAGIVAPLKKCGTLFFVLQGVDHAFHIDIFVAREYTGTITECVLLPQTIVDVSAS